MKTNEIQFGGKSYVCRIVEANDGEELLIIQASVGEPPTALQINPTGTFRLSLNILPK